MLFSFLMIAVGIVCVTYGANFLVDGAAAIAKKLRISDLIIGLTIVSFGTSAPEMIVSVFAALSGNTDVAVGNVVGSNILNIWLILGVAGLMMSMKVQSSTLWKEIPFALLGILVAFVFIEDNWINGSGVSEISRTDGIVLLGFFAIYLVYMFDSARKNPEELDETFVHRNIWLSILLIVAGITGLTLGGKFIVDNAVTIARHYGVSDAIISLTLVSIGTSIPELATSAVAAYKQKGDIAIGNVVGSNIFNTFLILGVTSIIAPLPLLGVDAIDFGVCVFATISLFVLVLAFNRKAIYKTEAIIFLMFYVAYTTYLLMKA